MAKTKTAFQRAETALRPGMIITVFENGRAVEHRVLSMSDGMINTPMKAVDPQEVVEIGEVGKTRVRTSFRDDPEAHMADAGPLLEQARKASH